MKTAVFIAKLQKFENYFDAKLYLKVQVLLDFLVDSAETAEWIEVVFGMATTVCQTCIVSEEVLKIKGNCVKSQKWPCLNGVCYG